MRFIDLEGFSELPVELMRKWFISCLEQRCLTLHNRSMRELRMARVLEARDAMGFRWSQVIFSPRVILKMRVFQDGQLYPEMLGKLFMFNVEPGSPGVKIYKTLFDDKLRRKFLFADRGDWTNCVCIKQGLSPAVLPLWTQHLSRHDSDGARGILTTSRPMFVSALSVVDGEVYDWQACCSGVGLRPQTPRAHIRATFYRSTATTCRSPEVLPDVYLLSNGETCRREFAAPAKGVLMVEASLHGNGPLHVALH